MGMRSDLSSARVHAHTLIDSALFLLLLLLCLLSRLRHATTSSRRRFMAHISKVCQLAATRLMWFELV